MYVYCIYTRRCCYRKCTQFVSYIKYESLYIILLEYNSHSVIVCIQGEISYFLIGRSCMFPESYFMVAKMWFTNRLTKGGGGEEPKKSIIFFLSKNKKRIMNFFRKLSFLSPKIFNTVNPVQKIVTINALRKWRKHQVAPHRLDPSAPEPLGSDFS